MVSSIMEMRLAQNVGRVPIRKKQFIPTLFGVILQLLCDFFLLFAEGRSHPKTVPAYVDLLMLWKVKVRRRLADGFVARLVVG